MGYIGVEVHEVYCEGIEMLEQADGMQVGQGGEEGVRWKVFGGRTTWGRRGVGHETLLV